MPILTALLATFSFFHPIHFPYHKSIKPPVIVAPPSNPVPPTTPTSGWIIKSIDTMKMSRDVICSPPSQTQIDAMVSRIKDLGANYVAISGYYDNPACGNSTTLISNWVYAARSHGLKVWFRMKDLSFEGDYSVPKAYSPDGNRHITLMPNWIQANKSLLWKVGEKANN